MIGTVTEGAIYTTDGGQRWQGAMGVGRTVCDVNFSEKTPNVVWMTARVGSNLIFRLQNGGQTFAAVAADTGFEKGVCVQIVPNPHDTNAASTYYEQNLYVVDAAARAMTASTCCGGRITRTAHSVTEPNVVYAFVIPNR